MARRQAGWLDASAGDEIENKIRAIVTRQNIELSVLRTQKKGAIITAGLEIILPSGLDVKEAEEISQKLRASLMTDIKNLQYVSIQIRSHDLETDFYKPNIGRGFGWHRQGTLARVDGVSGARRVHDPRAK